MDNLIWVSNLGRAAALSLKYNVVETRLHMNTKFNKNEVQFGFTRDLETKAEMDAYDNGTCPVDALAFFRALGELRNTRWELLNGKTPQDENLTNLH